ncbi:MAG: hypothetical protein ACRESZ_19765 [Methylococcales bacterium]
MVTVGKAVLHMLDTDIASYVIKGRSSDLEAKLMAVSPSMVCISAVTRAELIYEKATIFAKT